MRALVLALSLLAAGATRVDTRRPIDPKVKAASDEYQAGKKLFDKGDYDGAIAHYEKAYAADGDPNLLVISSEAYRKKHDCARAIELYQKFLDVSPKAKNRSLIQERIDELKKYEDDPFSEDGANPCVAPEPTPSPSR